METTKNTSKNLIHSKKKQAEIILQKTEIIEDSLIDAFPYIDVPTAQNLLDYSTRGTMKVLSRMVDMRILKMVETRSKENRKIKLFSLTPSAKKSEKAKDIPVWNLKNHVLANQKHDMSLHLLCRDLKELYSHHLDEFTFRQNFRLSHGKTTRTSDLTMEFGNEQLPIEFERTLKSKVRYPPILKICFEYFERHSVAFMWVFENENMAHRFHKIVQSVSVPECRNAVDIFVWDRDAPLGQRIKPLLKKIWSNPIQESRARTYFKHKAHKDALEEKQQAIDDEETRKYLEPMRKEKARKELIEQQARSWKREKQNLWENHKIRYISKYHWKPIGITIFAILAIIYVPSGLLEIMSWIKS